MKRSHAAAPVAPRAPARAVHPSLKLAQALVRWLERADVPPSVVLAQGLALARSPVQDGLPVEQVRAGLRGAEGDNRVVMGLLDRLKRPNVDKAAVIAESLRPVWIDKRAVQSVRPKAAAPQHRASRPAKPVTTSAPRTAPVVVVKRSSRAVPNDAVER